MLNTRQIDLGEKILVNSANVVLATMVLGFLLTRGFNLFVFLGGCILFGALVSWAFWLRKGPSA